MNDFLTETLCLGWCCGEPQPRPDGNRPGGRHAQQGSRLNNEIAVSPKKTTKSSPKICEKYRQNYPLCNS